MIKFTSVSVQHKSKHKLKQNVIFLNVFGCVELKMCQIFSWSYLTIRNLCLVFRQKDQADGRNCKDVGVQTKELGEIPENDVQN